MRTGYHIVVCGSLVPDPLQTLEPTTGQTGPALKNEMMLPAVLDPWASHALYEAAHLAAQHEESKVWLVSLGPKAKLQQLMMKARTGSRRSRRLADINNSGSSAPQAKTRKSSWKIMGNSRIDTIILKKLCGSLIIFILLI